MPSFGRVAGGPFGRANMVHPGLDPGYDRDFVPNRIRGTNNFGISGVAKDRGTGNPVAGATIDLFRTGDDSKVATTTSAGDGTFSFVVPANSGTFYFVGYLPGSPDQTAASVNTLVLTQV